MCCHTSSASCADPGCTWVRTKQSAAPPGGVLFRLKIQSRSKWWLVKCSDSQESAVSVIYLPQAALPGLWIVRLHPLQCEATLHRTNSLWHC